MTDLFTPSGGKDGMKGQKKKAKESRDLRRMCAIIDAHDWFGMLTLRFPTSYNLPDEDEDRFVRQLCHMLSDRFRADELDIGSFIRREFGKRPRRALHYHILFTSETISDLPADTLERLQRAWLRMVGAEDNQPRYFNWKAPHDGEYLKKRLKAGQNVISIPPSYKDIKFSPHFFHTRGLGRKGGLGKDGEQPTQDIPLLSSCHQSKASSCYPVTATPAPYWSAHAATGSKCDPSQNTAAQKNTDSCSDLAGSAAQTFTQNGTKNRDSGFTRSISGSHTNRASDRNPNFTQNEFQEVCETCEYHGRSTPVIPDLDTCPECGFPWEVCCPF